ncbi:transposase family protein [Clostridioides difficile]|nr:transposase family protein [Clostridioides difficile]NJK16208.1 transposase family protein [Clostridioides difficile]
MSIKYKDKVVVIVEIEDIDKLNESKIKYETLENGNYYVVQQGRRNKRFNDEMQKQIREELENSTIRAIAKKYKTSTGIIQSIKDFKY